MIYIILQREVRNERNKQETVAEKIKKRRPQQFGHVERTEGKRLPIADLHGHDCGGKEKQREAKEDLDGQRQGRPEQGKIDLARIREI